MKFLLFTILVYCAVNCEDVGNNYYVIEMPTDDEMPNSKKPFQVYWNVPTMQCRSKQIPFDDLYEKFGIIQNEGDKFRGEKITIMYEPGLFPAIFKNETSGKYRFRNGGVPQEGNLDDHLTVFKKDVQEIVPDLNFSGIGIIDFESWRPIFRQNFGTLVPYKDVSIEIEKKLHWWWPKPWINEEAQRRFEASARTFMQTTLSIAKQMRPKASWGYYGFPHCFNMANVRNMKENCPSNVVSENDITRWMWLESTALYPSVYSSGDLSSSQLGLLVRGRVEEAYRVKRYDTPILPYFWFRYRDGGFMKEEDLNVVLQSLYKSNASGFIIWGSSNDVNTNDKCQKLHDYVETILGPAIAKYLQKINRVDDAPVEPPIENNLNDTINETLTTIEDIISTTDKTIFNETIDNLNSTNLTKTTQFDPEFDWVPPENYSQDIAHNVDEELSKKGYDTTDDKEVGFKLLNDSMITDILFDVLFKSEFSLEKNQQEIREAQNETLIPIAIDITTESPKFQSKDVLITKEPNYENDILSKEIITNDIIMNSTPKLNSDITLDENETAELNSETDKINTTEDELVFAEKKQSTDIIAKDPYVNYVSTQDPIKENSALFTASPSVEIKSGNDEVLKSADPNTLMNMIFNAFVKVNVNKTDSESYKQSIEGDKNITENTETSEMTEKLTTQNYITDKESIENKIEEESKELQGVLSNVTSSNISSTSHKYDSLDNATESVKSNNNGNTSTELDEFLIVSTNNSNTDFDTTTQYNTDSDLRSDRSEVESVNQSDFTDSVSDIKTFTSDSEIVTNVDHLVRSSESTEYLKSEDSYSSDVTTESTDQVVTYVYYS